MSDMITRDIRMIVTDLDETLLTSEKTITPRTVRVLERCREQGILIVFSTARDELNIRQFIDQVHPDIIISSGGALITRGGYKHGETIFCSMFTAEETRTMIDKSFELLGPDCEVTIDALEAHYWNMHDEAERGKFNFLNIVYTDYSDFHDSALKVSVMTHDAATAAKISSCVDDCYGIPFSDIPWYKFAKTDATKENALRVVSRYTGIPLEQMAAFGDDFGDIGMLDMCGLGVAVANAIPEVLAAADDTAPDNNSDGVARYIEAHILRQS